MDLVHKSYCLHIAVVFFIKKIKYCNSDIYLTVKVMWHTAKYGDPYSEFVLCINPSNVPTHISEHTHSVNTHTPWTHTLREHTPGAVGSHLCCGARGAVGGSVPYSRAPQSWYWWWSPAGHSLPSPTIAYRPETRTRNLSIMSPTLMTCKYQISKTQWPTCL